MSAEAAGCWEDAGRSLHQHWAFIGPVRFLKRTRGQKTPCRLDRTAGPELSAARGGVGGWLPHAPELWSPDAPHQICREGLLCRTRWGACKCSAQEVCGFAWSGLEKPQGWVGGIPLWTPPMALSCVLYENADRPDLSGNFFFICKTGSWIWTQGITPREGHCHAWE